MIGLLGWLLALVVIGVRVRRRRWPEPRAIRLLADEIENPWVSTVNETPYAEYAGIEYGRPLDPTRAALLRVTGRCARHQDLGDRCTVVNCTTLASGE